MTTRRLLSFLLFCLVLPSALIAAPTVSVLPSGLNAGNREWLVQVSPDETLFSDNPPNGLGGSVAVELAFSIDDPVDLLSVVIADPVDWEFENPGFNPFTGGITDGVYIDLAADNSFVAYGSRYFTTGDPSSFLKITTAGTGLTTLRYGEAASGDNQDGARMAQAAMNFVGYTGIVTVPEPSTLLLGAVALAALWSFRTRRRPGA